MTPHRRRRRKTRARDIPSRSKALSEINTWFDRPKKHVCSPFRTRYPVYIDSIRNGEQHGRLGAARNTTTATCPATTETLRRRLGPAAGPHLDIDARPRTAATLREPAPSTLIPPVDFSQSLLVGGYVWARPPLGRRDLDCDLQSRIMDCVTKSNTGVILMVIVTKSNAGSASPTQPSSKHQMAPKAHRALDRLSSVRWTFHVRRPKPTWKRDGNRNPAAIP